MSKAEDISNLLSSILDREVPMSSDLIDELDHLGLMLPETTAATISWREIMCYQLVLKAARGNDKSITELLDRMMGKPAQQIHQTNTNLSYTEFLHKVQMADEPPEIIAHQRITPLLEIDYTEPEMPVDLDEDNDAIDELFT